MIRPISIITSFLLFIWPFMAFGLQVLGKNSIIQCGGDGMVDVVANANAPVDLLSNPQLAPPGNNPLICAIRGTSDIASVKLDPGKGLDLPQGSISLGAGDILTLIWDEEVQLWRSPNLIQATDDWKAVVGLRGVSPRDVHDMVEYDDGTGNRLYLCGYKEWNAVVASFDPVSGELVVEFEIPGGTAPGLRCRNIEVFKGSLYVALGSNFSSLDGGGDVYRWDGGATVTKVLDTDDGDMYALAVSLDGMKLYAGGGTVASGTDNLSNGGGKLWTSNDGNSWELLKNFGPEYEVVRWIAPDPVDGRLYISTRNKANLWSTVDDLYFEDHGAPPGMHTQVKSFTFHNGKLFLGGVKASIWVFTRLPDTYTRLIDLKGVTQEVYHADTCGDFVYFAARSGHDPTTPFGTSGGQVFQCNAQGCIIVYVDKEHSGAFHSVYAAKDGSLYLGTGAGADMGSSYSKLRKSHCR